MSERCHKVYDESISGELSRLRDFDVDIRHAVLIQGRNILCRVTGRDLDDLRDRRSIAGCYRYYSFSVVGDVAIFILGDYL